MFYSQHDRVFMRSLATGGRAGGLSPGTERCLEVLKRDPVGGGFDVVLVETVGIGQEAVPFAPGLVDKTLFVMSPEYGSRLQLQKIAMLDTADIVVVNKSDMAAAKTASSEVEQRLAMNRRSQRLVSTMAKRHRDAGVDSLFEMLNGAPIGEVGARGVTCVIAMHACGEDALAERPISNASAKADPSAGSAYEHSRTSCRGGGEVRAIRRRAGPRAAPTTQDRTGNAPALGIDPFQHPHRHHAHRPETSAPGPAGDRRIRADRGVSPRRRPSGRISVQKRRISRNVPRTDATRRTKRPATARPKNRPGSSPAWGWPRTPTQDSAI